ncbi:putative membrane transport protein [Helianthus annuus]|nr:putative membrane transport protein [Helianthus annuus]
MVVYTGKRGNQYGIRLFFWGCWWRLFVVRHQEFFRFTVIVTGFGNTGNLVMAIVGSVCHDTDNSFGSDCQTTGTAYVSLAQWMSVLLVYTLVYHMMEPPMEYYEVVEKEDDGEIEIVHENLPVNDLSRPLLHEAEWPGMDDKETVHCKTPFIARVFCKCFGFFGNVVTGP